MEEAASADDRTGEAVKEGREAGPANCTRFTMRCRHIKNRLSAWTKGGEQGARVAGGREGEHHTDRGPLQCGIQTRLLQRQRCSTNLQFNSAPQNRSNDRRLEIA